MSIASQRAGDDIAVPEPFDEQQDRQFDRVPPQDVNAEQSVLGGMLLSKDAIAEVVEVLKAPRPGVFYRPAHELIYAVAYRMWTEGDPVDPITLAAELTRLGEITRAGGAPYLHTLVQQVPTAANAAYYAEIVLERSVLRLGVEIGTRLAQRCYAAQGDPKDIYDAAQAELQQVVSGTDEAPKTSVADRWQSFVDQLEAGADPDALDTPWADLNEVLEIKPGELITIGAATSGGKSLMAVNWGTHAALRRGKQVLMFSLEMDGAELLARMTAAEAKVNLTKLIQRKGLTDDDWKKIAKVSDRMQNAHNFKIEDSGSATLGDIRARARWMASRGETPGLIIVDYLQLMNAEKEAGNQNRAQEVAAISRGLKRIAMDFRVPVIALAQFNRGSAGRQPTLTDFKESSAIEQDSNIVLILHIETDAEDQPVRPGEVDVIVAKNRNGARGRKFPLAMQGHYARLVSMARP
ncbi:replicative DNA helicase [Streptomyces sp. NPDC053048]|uniref:replicative DNA helicase n=1 Tax=Streptomyces sp. NPDC053048 TaxID=3365694 RepID=UPI0037D7E585